MYVPQSCATPQVSVPVTLITDTLSRLTCTCTTCTCTSVSLPQMANTRTFVVEPHGYLLVHVIKHTNRNSQQYLWHKTQIRRAVAALNPRVDPVLKQPRYCTCTCTYMYIFTYMYRYMYIHVVYTSTSTCLCTYMYIPYLHVHMYIHVHKHVHVLVY